MALKVGVVGMGGIGNTHAECHKKDPWRTWSRSATW